MRLSDENTREGRHLTPEERIALQAEEIKQLRQENEQLQAQAARMRDVLDELTSELDYAHLLENGIEWDKHKSKTFDGALELLKNIPADYHNPADVEALRKARNLLQRYKDHIKSYPCECKFGLDFYGNKTPFRDGEMCERCAELAAIDKVIGGKEDA